LRAILSIFVVLTLVARISFATEAKSTFISDSGEYTAQMTTIASSFSLSSDSNECEDNGCHRSSSHCSHHCIGSHNASLTNQDLVISPLYLLNTKLQWYLGNHYQIPFLEPSTKPPLHS
jgi:hypothetical protein